MLTSIFVAALAIAPQTENVIFLFTDGLRWQEVFTGSDASLGKVPDQFQGETAEKRRAALMPYVWSVIANQGQLYGNREKGSTSRVLNPHKFSYPGYSETIQGFYDPVIASNDPVPNPNATVFEWLAKKPAFKGRVAGFANWWVVSAIFNKDRCGFYTQCGPEPISFSSDAAAQLYNRLIVSTDRNFAPDPDDSFTHEAAMMYLKVKKPRVMAVLYGETDSWAHSGDYAKYLDSANRFDRWVREYWDALQATPQYKNKTTLIITTDHGRGDGKAWTSHGASVASAEFTWIMVIGPDTPALGERENVATVTNGQVATTIAELLGENYRAAQPKAARALKDAIR